MKEWFKSENDALRNFVNGKAGINMKYAFLPWRQTKILSIVKDVQCEQYTSEHLVGFDHHI